MHPLKTERKDVMLTPKEIAYAVTKALDEKKGMDIKLLKIDRVSSLADYFLICTGTMEYNLTVKRNEVVTPAKTWMNLENIMLSERSQSQKDKLCMIPFM